MDSSTKESAGDRDLLARVLEVLESARALEAEMEEALRGVDPRNADGARNFVHYVAMRQRDLRPLQWDLAERGLSSLGRAEPHVLGNLEAVAAWLGEGGPRSRQGLRAARSRLSAHTDALLGPARAARDVRILVTLPSEAADEPPLLRDLVAAGADAVRINCAHDGPDRWQRMAEHARAASREQGRACRVLMDLAGPKLRTGAFPPGPKVLKWRPERDAKGEPRRPALVALVPEGESAAAIPNSATLPIPRALCDRLRPGDEVRFHDLREKKRALRVVSREGSRVLAEGWETAYVVPGTKLRVRAGGESQENPRGGEGAVGDLPASPTFLLLRAGDRLILRRDGAWACEAERDAAGRCVAPASVGCTLPEAIEDLRAGERVLFDDGRIQCVVEEAVPEGALLAVRQTLREEERLGADKGINLPDTTLRVRGLTAEDRTHLDFVAAHADLVGLSFVHGPEDVADLFGELRARRAERLGVVLKIETQAGFQRLPRILLAALRWYPVGLMIARGDLAVECGYERLAELQEEVLWLAEAAHVPVVWATQVLESLAKTGTPSRAEITDAAMGERAECVMLNKGPHLVEAVRTLGDILGRMSLHQDKKVAMLRRLSICDPRAILGG